VYLTYPSKCQVRVSVDAWAKLSQCRIGGKLLLDVFLRARLYVFGGKVPWLRLEINGKFKQFYREPVIAPNPARSMGHTPLGHVVIALFEAYDQLSE
jgi:hypothetical protein